ncbi:hypothetical protein ACFOZ0_29580 [Streptomyces yaanensis]|uniref:Uncharacterized protein n=1 Tax=Streptomyces yaanensis TaxID=1142239 RepID=A0ABV7SK76_9ACTN|nr:hypothetical protein [Streptomyces sp. CGMCC 4.7035]WNC00941.1 hypothetical protein Q2K21_24395 [Streptomyces sp. CGMCC 4.7035]
MSSDTLAKPAAAAEEAAPPRDETFQSNAVGDCFTWTARAGAVR